MCICCLPCRMNECFRLFVEVVVERLKVRREAREAKTRAEEPKQDSDKGSVNAADATAESTSQPDNAESKAVKPMGEAGSQGKKFLRCIFIFFIFLFNCLLELSPIPQSKELASYTQKLKFCLQHYQSKYIFTST